MKSLRGTKTLPRRSYKHRAIEQTERKGGRRRKSVKVTFVLLLNSFEITAAKYKKKTRIKCWGFEQGESVIKEYFRLQTYKMRSKCQCHTHGVKITSICKVQLILKKHKIMNEKNSFFSE